MSVIICKHPVVRIDILCKKACWPVVVGTISNCGGSYDDEEFVTINNEPWVQIHNVEGTNWKSLGNAIALISQKSADSAEDNIYILINTKKKGTKKNVEEVRPETDAGCESGDRGESAVDSQQGNDLGSGGNGGSDGVAGDSDSGSPEVSEAADDDCE